MLLFTKPYQVIRPVEGTYVDGVWVPGTDPGSADTVLLNLQPGGSTDYERARAMPGGLNVTDLLVAFGAPGSLTPAGNGAGDVLIYRGDRYLCIGEIVRDTLGADTEHAKYLLTREIPQASGEA